ASIYEFKVWGICAESESNTSPVILLRTDTLKSGYETWAAMSCGKPLPTIDLKNRAPLALLQAGDKILAADFTVTVLSANGGNGKYSGTGLVKLPFTGSVPIPCNFEQVGINTDFRLIEGSIRLLRKPLELSNRSLKSLADNWQQRFGDNWNRFETKTYPGDIRNISVNPNGDIEVEGNTGTQKFTGGKNLEFVDASGNSWFVSPAGRVTKSEGKRMQPPVVEDIKTGKGMPNSISTGQSKVFFTCGNHQGYDGYEIRELTAGLDYDKLECGDTAYYAGWKLLTAGNADTIVANFTPGRKINIPADSVFFARSDGTLVPFIRQGNQFKLVVYGRMNLYCDAVWAMAYTGHLGYGGPKTTVLGKLNLISVDLRKIHVKLIPINGVGLSANEGELSNKLNALLSKQGLFYEVSKSKNILVGNYNEKTAKIKINRSVLNTSYGAELSEFIVALETRDPWVSTYQGIDTAYMFMLSQAENNEDGYMALNRNYGFVFLNGNAAPKPHVLAHETAHGLLNLEHVFSDEKIAGYSQNLMDYSPPFTLFHKDQWMLVFDNKKWGAQKLKLSQDEKRGKLLGGKLFTLEELKIPAKGPISFVAPDGKLITLQADSIDGVSFTGTYFASGTSMLSKRAAQANGTLTKVQYGGVFYYAKFYMGKYLGFVPAENPQSNRFDIPYYHPFAYSNSVAVYAGFEDTTCRFTIRSGNYANTNHSDTAIRYVNLTTESEIHQIDMGEECLEYFTEELLTPAAKRWWNLAKLNPNFVKNTNACRRIVRLIHDLGNDYKYFDLESYKSYLARVKPKISPPFSDPVDPFTEKGLRSFENYLRASYESLVSHELFFGNISDAQELGNVLSTIPKGILEQLSLPLRMKLLRKLTNAGLTNLGFYYGVVFLRENDNESVTWALIHTLPDNQVKDFLDSIISLIPSNKSPHLLAAWSNDILGLDGEEYYRFVSWMFRAIAKHYPPKDDWDMLEALEDNQLLSFNPGIAQGTVEYDYETDGKISLETLAVPDTKPIQTTLHPYDWTYLKFLDNFEFSGKKIKENSTLKLPAAIVAGIFDKENTNDAFTSAELALDIAMFAVGIGEVKAALEVGNLARKAWLATKAVADLGLSLGDVIITGGLGEQLDKTASGKAFLSRWNNIQLYYGIGSLAETGLSKLVYRLYDDYRAVKTWDNLDPKLQKELDGMVQKVEDFTGLKRIENLKLRAGKKIIGEQNLIQADVPISKFKKLRALESEQIVAYSARDFWLEEGTDFVQYLSEDAEYLIKHDPSTGRMLVADVQNQEVVYFSLDEDKLFASKLPAQDDAAYKELMLKTRTHLGLSGGLKEITIRGKKMVFSQDKANVLLGKWKAKDLPGIEGQELGTEEVMEELLMFKHYSHKDLDFELRPGSVQVLNIPTGSIEKTKELSERVGTFWDAYNLNFLDMIVNNKSRVNVVLVSDP
ncbi:MAG: hypothetical protein IT244_10780, partial [Bacteroidia bacterium]|nr:hypothetical protein [Bacteroidia bacterium]